MYGYQYPYYAYPSNNNEGFGSWWVKIIVKFIIFFLFWGGNYGHGGCSGRGN